MRVVIADDERLARIWLRNALETQGAEVVGEGQSGVDAIQLCAELQPDALFTDIRMPDLSGMEAVAAISQLPKAPRLVFVTGYAEHAAEAFEKAVFDYLLKPVSPARLALTLSRLRQAMAETAPAAPAEVTGGPLQRLPIRTDYAVRLLRVEQIECAVAREKRVFVRTKEEEFKTTYTLTQLEGLLPADKFFRVHASVIVQLERVEQINFLGNHSYSARLASGINVPIGRNQYPGLQERLGVA